MHLWLVNYAEERYIINIAKSPAARGVVVSLRNRVAHKRWKLEMGNLVIKQPWYSLWHSFTFFLFLSLGESFPTLAQSRFKISRAMDCEPFGCAVGNLPFTFRCLILPSNKRNILSAVLPVAFCSPFQKKKKKYIYQDPSKHEPSKRQIGFN